jgi:outer membrane lipoprotein carrier protein
MRRRGITFRAVSLAELMKNPCQEGFVTGHDFSRADKVNQIKGGFSPCYLSNCTTSNWSAICIQAWRGITFRAISLLLLAAYISPAIYAQSKPSSTPSATELAKRVDDHYNHLQSLKTTFTERYEGLGMARSESGVMMLRKPGKMRWEYQTTAGKLFVLDGKYAWFYTPGQSQVQRIPAGKLDDLRSPLRFLLGHTRIESELENLTLSTKDGSFTLSGVPKGQQKRIAKLSLGVTPNGSIASIEIDEIDGAKTLFDFTNEEPNATIPESAFHFTPPAGVPVVDALPPV